MDINALNCPTILDFQLLATAQQADPEIPALQASSSLRLQDIPLPFFTGTILCDVSTASPRPYVPPSFRRLIFDQLHSLSHPGIRASQQLITERYVWPGINKDVRQWARSCQKCQEAKVHRHITAPPGTFLTPDARFDHLHIDIVGPLPLSQGFRYLLTVIDRFTRWPEAIPLTDITAESIASAFISRLVSNFGVPSTVTTDRGSQFESSLFSLVTSLLGITRISTTAYHPSSNAMVERFHLQLKGSIKAYQDTTKWIEILPLALLGIRNTIKADLHCTPAQLIYGTTLRLPGQFITPTSSNDLDPTVYADRLQRAMQALRSVLPRPQTVKSYVLKDLSSCTHVFVRTDAVRKPLQPPYTGPYKVLKRTNKHFTLEMHGRKENISVDRLKVAYLDTDILPPSPPVVIPVTSTSRTSAQANARSVKTTRLGRKVHFPDRLNY